LNKDFVTSNNSGTDKNLIETTDLLYLACPYSHHSEQLIELRFHIITEIAANLMKDGHIVFSPITHSHLVNQHLKVKGTWEFWRHQDLAMLDRSDVLVVACLKGWEHSVGVSAELIAAKDLGLNIQYLDPLMWCDRTKIKVHDMIYDEPKTDETKTEFNNEPNMDTPRRRLVKHDNLITQPEHLKEDKYHKLKKLLQEIYEYEQRELPMF